MLSSRKWTLRPVAWIPLLIRLQNCGIYYHRASRKLIPYSSSNHFYQNGMDRNAIVTVVIYATLTMFKWCHIDSSLFYTFSSFSNAVCIEFLCGHFVLCDMHWFYGFYIDGQMPILLMWYPHYWQLPHLVSVRLNFSVFYVCVFKCFSSHLSPVSYHPSPSSSRLIAFWLMLLVCSLCDTK